MGSSLPDLLTGTSLGSMVVGVLFLFCGFAHGGGNDLCISFFEGQDVSWKQKALNLPEWKQLLPDMVAWRCTHR
jgi:hypothetical protein